MVLPFHRRIPQTHCACVNARIYKRTEAYTGVNIASANCAALVLEKPLSAEWGGVQSDVRHLPYMELPAILLPEKKVFRIRMEIKKISKRNWQTGHLPDHYAMQDPHFHRHFTVTNRSKTVSFTYLYSPSAYSYLHCCMSLCSSLFWEYVLTTAISILLAKSITISPYGLLSLTSNLPVISLSPLFPTTSEKIQIKYESISL